jgi:hypothetical protein
MFAFYVLSGERTALGERNKLHLTGLRPLYYVRCRAQNTYWQRLVYLSDGAEDGKKFLANLHASARRNSEEEKRMMEREEERGIRTHMSRT